MDIRYFLIINFHPINETNLIILFILKKTVTRFYFYLNSIKRMLIFIRLKRKKKQREKMKKNLPEKRVFFPREVFRKFIYLSIKSSFLYSASN